MTGRNSIAPLGARGVSRSLRPVNTDAVGPPTTSPSPRSEPASRACSVCAPPDNMRPVAGALHHRADGEVVGGPTSHGPVARPRAVLYARVSTADQDPGVQLDELRAVARQRGWTVVAELVEVGSGARADLPRRSEALDLAHRGAFDIFAAWKLDRIARSLRDLVNATHLLERAGVELVTVRDAIDTGTPAGQFLFHILGAVAQFERALIRERVVAGLARARRQGTKLGRPRRPVDVLIARGLLSRGLSVREAARKMRVSPRTLTRALDRAGVARKPSVHEVGQPAEIPTPAEPEIDDAKGDDSAPEGAP